VPLLDDPSTLEAPPSRRPLACSDADAHFREPVAAITPAGQVVGCGEPLDLVTRPAGEPSGVGLRRAGRAGQLVERADREADSSERDVHELVVGARAGEQSSDRVGELHARRLLADRRSAQSGAPAVASPLLPGRLPADHESPWVRGRAGRRFAPPARDQRGAGGPSRASFRELGLRDLPDSGAVRAHDEQVPGCAALAEHDRPRVGREPCAPSTLASSRATSARMTSPSGSRAVAPDHRDAQPLDAAQISPGDHGALTAATRRSRAARAPARASPPHPRSTGTIGTYATAPVESGQECEPLRGASAIARRVLLAACGRPVCRRACARPHHGERKGGRGEDRGRFGLEIERHAGSFAGAAWRGEGDARRFAGGRRRWHGGHPSRRQ
jgi:hypothetical protein